MDKQEIALLLLLALVCVIIIYVLALTDDWCRKYPGDDICQGNEHTIHVEW